MNPTPTRGPEVEKLIQYMVKRGATDLSVEPNRPLVLQVQGAAREAEMHPIARFGRSGVYPRFGGQRRTVPRACFQPSGSTRFGRP